MPIIHKAQYLYNNQILVREFFGEVSCDDIIDSWNYIKSENLLKENVAGIINDLHNCTLTMNMNDFQRLIQFLKSMETLKHLKLAVITDNPHNIVFPSIIEHKEDELKIKPFYTLNEAVKWILHY